MYGIKAVAVRLIVGVGVPEAPEDIPVLIAQHLPGLPSRPDGSRGTCPRPHRLTLCHRPGRPALVRSVAQFVLHRHLGNDLDSSGQSRNACARLRGLRARTGRKTKHSPQYVPGIPCSTPALTVVSVPLTCWFPTCASAANDTTTTTWDMGRNGSVAPTPWRSARLHDHRSTKRCSNLLKPDKRHASALAPGFLPPSRPPTATWRSAWQAPTAGPDGLACAPRRGGTALTSRCSTRTQGGDTRP